MTDIPEGFEIESAPSSGVPAGFEIEKPREPSRWTEGSILPFRRDQHGNEEWGFYGPLGSLKRAFMAPGDVLSGKLDPYSAEARDAALDTALTFNPAAAVPSRALRVIPKAPTTDQLKTAADAGYKAVRDAGVDYAPQAIKALGDDALKGLQENVLLKDNAPLTYAILGTMDSPSVSPISHLDVVRQRLGDIAGLTGDKKQDAKAATFVLKKIDEFLDAANPENLVIAAQGQEAKEAARNLRDARGNAASRFRSDRLTGVEEAAELRAASRNAEHNIGNDVRSRLTTMLLSEEGRRGFSPLELAAMEDVVRGTASANTLRTVSDWLGGGSKFASTIYSAAGGGVGLGVGGPVGFGVGAAIPLATSQGTRWASNALTRRQLNAVDEATRRRSPLYQQMLENAGTKVPVSPRNLEILRRLAGAETAAMTEPSVVPNTRGPGRPRKINPNALSLDQSLDAVLGTNDTFAELAAP